MDTVKRQARKRRIRTRVQGSAERPRVSVYRSNRGLYVQLIDDDAQQTIAAVLMTGADNQQKIAQATAAGEQLAKKAKEKDVQRVVFDRAGYQYHGRIKALADALRAGGINF